MMAGKGMTHDLFCLLSPKAQLYQVFTCGTSLAQRWEGEEGVHLYHLPGAGSGFFVEVGLDEMKGYFSIRRSFSDSEPLANYAQGIRLPD